MSTVDMKRIDKIRKRAEAAKPEYTNITSVMGSGHNFCTAVVAEDPESGNVDFLVDVYPEYVKGERYLDIGADKHIARLKFFERVFSDMNYLIDFAWKQALYVAMYEERHSVNMDDERYNKLLQETRWVDEHPPGWDCECMCQLCCSYGY